MVSQINKNERDERDIALERKARQINKNKRDKRDRNIREGLFSQTNKNERDKTERSG